ncbi:MAG: elongation factor P [Dehalococcoidia bacterium]
MTISSGEIKRNMTILLEGEVYQILDWQHRQAPKAPPTLTLKVRNILTGNVYEKKLQGNQKLTRAETDNISAQYLYQDDTYYCFMDNATFEQLNIDKSIIADNIKFISEGDNVELIMFNGNALAIELPPSVILEIGQTDVGLKGDTQSGANKPATTITGLTLQVPLFVNTGDKINVNTTTGEYTGRAD